MANNNLRPKLSNIQTIAKEDVNQYHDALSGNVVPRDSNGQASTTGPSLGTASLRWGELFVENIHVSGGIFSQNPIEVTRPINSIISNSPSISNFLRINNSSGNGRGITVSKGIKFIADGLIFTSFIDRDHSFPTGEGNHRYFNAPTDFKGTINEDYELTLEGKSSAGYGTTSGSWAIIDQYKTVGNTVALQIQNSSHGAEDIALVKILEVSSGIPTRFGHGQRAAFKGVSGKFLTNLSGSDAANDAPLSSTDNNFGQLELYWIFDGVSSIFSTNIEPLYGQDTTARPSSPSSGQYFFSISELKWSAYENNAWVDKPRYCLIGLAALSDSACVGVREFDPHKNFSNYNDIALDVNRSYDSGTKREVYLKRRESRVSVFGEDRLLKLDSNWTYSNKATYGNKGFLYVTPYGELIADGYRPFYYPNRKGYYHRENSNRCVGKWTKESSGTAAVVTASALPFAVNSYDPLRQGFYIDSGSNGLFARSSYDHLTNAIEFKTGTGNDEYVNESYGGVGDFKALKIIYHTGNPTTYASRLEALTKIKVLITAQTEWTGSGGDTSVPVGIYLGKGTTYLPMAISGSLGPDHTAITTSFNMEVGDRIGFATNGTAYNNKSKLIITLYIEERP